MFFFLSVQSERKTTLLEKRFLFDHSNSKIPGVSQNTRDKHCWRSLFSFSFFKQKIWDYWRKTDKDEWLGGCNLVFCPLSIKDEMQKKTCLCVDQQERRANGVVQMIWLIDWWCDGNSIHFFDLRWWFSMVMMMMMVMIVSIDQIRIRRWRRRTSGCRCCCCRIWWIFDWWKKSFFFENRSKRFDFLMKINVSFYFVDFTRRIERVFPIDWVKVVVVWNVLWATKRKIRRSIFSINFRIYFVFLLTTLTIVQIGR